MAEPVQIRKTRTQQLNELLADSKNRSYFVGTVTVLFFVFFVAFGVIPAFNNVLAQHSENSRIQEGIGEVTKKRNDLQSMVTERGEISQLLNFFDFIFPNSDPQEEVVRELYGHADDLSLFISNVVFSEDVNDTELQQRWVLNTFVNTGQIRLEVSGNLDALLDYIHFLESSRRIYNVESLTLFGDTEQSLLDDLETEDIEDIDDELAQNLEDGDITNEEITSSIDRFKLSITLRYFYWNNQVTVL